MLETNLKDSKFKIKSNKLKSLVYLTTTSLEISSIFKDISSGIYSIEQVKNLCNKIWELRDFTGQVPFRKDVIEFVEDNDKPEDYYKIIGDNLDRLRDECKRIRLELMNSEDVLKSIVNKF